MKFTISDGESTRPTTSDISHPHLKMQRSLRCIALSSLLLFSGCGTIVTSHQYQHNAARTIVDRTHTSSCNFPSYPIQFFPAPGITVSVGEETRQRKGFIVIDITLKTGAEFKLDRPILIDQMDGTVTTVIDQLTQSVASGWPIKVAVTNQLTGPLPGTLLYPNQPYTIDIYAYHTEFAVPEPRPKRLKITIPNGKIKDGVTVPIIVNFSDVEIKWQQACSFNDLK